MQIVFIMLFLYLLRIAHECMHINFIWQIFPSPAYVQSFWTIICYKKKRGVLSKLKLLETVIYFKFLEESSRKIKGADERP
jgi:hypothetical protein